MHPTELHCTIHPPSQAASYRVRLHPTGYWATLLWIALKQRCWCLSGTVIWGPIAVPECFGTGLRWRMQEASASMPMPSYVISIQKPLPVHHYCKRIALTGPTRTLTASKRQYCRMGSYGLNKVSNFRTIDHQNQKKFIEGQLWTLLTIRM
jgi:hypothetical protein